MKSISIQGSIREFTADEIQQAKQNNLAVKNSFTFSSARGISDEHKLEISDNDLLEFVFEDNTTWVGSKDIIHDLFPSVVKGKRADEGISIPMYLEAGESDRGLGTIALKLLNVFAKKAVTAKVIDLAANLEKKALNNQSGVFGIDANFHLGKAKITEEKKPNLLFIHGTNSSTWGSFAEIRQSDLWKYMQQTYGANIFGFQHETMTMSPIQNVIRLIKELPGSCTLHIITHSRGGLVGDVLARFCNGNEGFTEQEISYLSEQDDRQRDVNDIKTLQSLVKNKSITIEKFIRVACPAYGTTILSKRLDHFLNISCNLISLAGGATALIAGEFKALISAAVDTKNDPNELPGLEAMNPASPFLKILNNPNNKIQGSLTVISGNCGLKLSWKALLIIASKLFYLRDNDLVVDTRSMYCGSKRETAIQYFFDEGPDVDHVHYFANKKTQDALLAALKSVDKSIPGFSQYQLTDKEREERNALLKLDGGEVYSDEASGNKPIVILLPGIMGSNLSVGKKKVWINYLSFLTGGLSRLKISAGDIKAESLIKTSYKKLVEYLRGEGYDVITFAFDWRLPLTNAALELKNKIDHVLKLKQPVKIIGHSMGGVVTRDFIINHPDTWEKLNKSAGFKLLLLGAPLGGSYRIPYVLTGKDSIINQLSKIDLVHSKEKLLDIFRRYPGLLGLLPLSDQPYDFAKVETWNQMKAASSFDWNIPESADLAEFGRYRDKVLKNMDDIDMSNIIYIAGQDDATVCGYVIDNSIPGDEKIVFKSTVEGDQSVTWDTGIPKNINRDKGLYFVNVSHGALANQPDIFKGISEILVAGKTQLLPKDKPVFREGKKEFDTVEEEIYDADESSVENVLLGLKTKPVTAKKGKSRVKVSVSNGDLFYSSYPVMVGHFLTDGITSAEAVIDKYTDNTLREWHRLSLYPGDIGTSEVFINLRNGFKGTVVIGLGAPGRLSAFQLSKSTEQGAIKYMLELKKMRQNNSHSGQPAETGISVLLIGCGYGGLSMESSIRAILQGIQNANEKAETLNQKGLSMIGQIEFIELFEDRCLQCLIVLSKIEKENDGELNIRLVKKQPKKLLGWKTRIPMENISDWWSRITVTLHKEENKETWKTETALRFNSSTGSAREEQRDLPQSPSTVDNLIQEMSVKNRWSEGLAKTVFELMIPNDFKDDIKKQANTMWVLDTTAAAYPWELLQGENNTSPICCTSGMIRQLQTDQYRLKINASTGNKALVIGDPFLDGSRLAPQLQGALDEARQVAFMLNQRGYDMPNNCFRGSASQILEAVFKDEYRILHLAGHGIFNAVDPERSGMLIGDGVFLTPRQICQMSKVPDLVFVNCCYLGQVNAQSEATYSNRYKLAANIGTQLIMNGVKVVIAAGWAVNDAAALRFAEVFYDQMFSGAEFGKAIKTARKEVHTYFPGTNTWGAYQCYGDPFFKLPNAYKPKGGVPKKNNEYEYFIAQEAEIDLSNLINKADAKDSSAVVIKEELERITRLVDQADLRNAAITEKEGMVYAECNDYQNAVERFEKLFSMEQASFTIRALEKYCNVRAKLCVQNWQKGYNKAEQFRKINAVIDDLNLLNKMSHTSERLSLLGSTFKRKALMIPSVKKNKGNKAVINTDKLDTLQKAADFYRKAYEQSKNSNQVYSLVNWLELHNILRQAAGNKTQRGKKRTPGDTFLEDAKKQIKKIIDEQKNQQADMDFWVEIGVANAKLCIWLLDEEPNKKAKADITGTYLNIWRDAGSQNKKIAEIEHFDFLIDAYTMLGKKQVTSVLEKIREDLNRYAR